MPFELDLSSKDKRFTVDAKSIMGIFSLDISQEMNLSVLGGDEEEHLALSTFEKFVVS